MGRGPRAVPHWREPTAADGAPGAWHAAIETADAYLVVTAPGVIARDEIAQIASLAEAVPASVVPEADLVANSSDGLVARAPRPVTGGQITSGRWVAFDADTADDASRRCLGFVGAIDLLGCGQPGSDTITTCGPVGMNIYRFAMATTAELDDDQLPLTVTVGGHPVDVTVERG